MTVPPFETRGVRGRILLLERASLLREVQVLLLRSAGYETVAIDDPAAALGQLELHRFDVVIVDGTHRELVAAEFLTGARRPRPVSIVAVLWQPSTLSSVDLLSRGVDRVVETPSSASALISVIDEVLGYRALPTAPTSADVVVNGADRVKLRPTDRAEARTSLPAARAESADRAWAVDNAFTPQ